MKRSLLDVYNDTIFKGVFSEEWRNYLCFFIPKANNDKDLFVCRFIFLNFSKKWLTKDFVGGIQYNKLINNLQFGFRMNKSYITLLYLYLKLKFNSIKSYLAAVFLDIKGAYDNVNSGTSINEFIEINL